ncbi:MAG: nucleotide exchange factor GrpE [Paludibacteraceae bacterium]
MKKQQKHDKEETSENMQENANQEVKSETTGKEVDKIADEIDQLNEKYAELADKNLRLMAEFDNYRKRTLKEKADLITTASERVMVDILPLVDDFERAKKAMENSDDIQAVKEGVDLIYSKFLSFLQVNGVKEIPTEGESFNVDIHEAVTTFPAPSDEQQGKIIDCISKGYTLNNKVIRFSKVVIGE